MPIVPKIRHYKILHYLEHQHGFAFRKKVTETILDKTYEVLKGSVRTSDYDDAWLLALGLDAKVIFDIGCNVGQSSLLLLYSASVERIFLVDPNHAALSVAAENLITNNLSHKAVFVPSFVSDTADRSVQFFTVGTGSAGSMYASHAQTASSIGASRQVTTTTVDSLAKYYNLSPDLIKIDVEGAEYLVLKGATEVASQQKARFMVEMHSNPELTMEENARNVINWCYDNSYHPWYLKEKLELKEPSQIKNRGRCHLLLLPEATTLPGYLMHLEQGAAVEKVHRSVK